MCFRLEIHSHFKFSVTQKKIALRVSDSVEDLGVTISSYLNFDSHTREVIAKATIVCFTILRGLYIFLIERQAHYFLNLWFGRSSNTEHASVWSPKRRDIDAIEKSREDSKTSGMRALTFTGLYTAKGSEE